MRIRIKRKRHWNASNTKTGVRSYHNPYHQGKGESTKHLAAHQEQDEHGKECQTAGQDRSRKSLIDGLVDHVSERFLAQQTIVLTDAIEDDDRVVHGITDQSQQRRDHRKRNLEVQQREKPQGDEDVMKDGQNGSGAVDPLESEGNIYQHAAQSIEGNVNRLLAELGANLGADNFDVANGERTERVAVFDGNENPRGDTVGFREVVKISDHAVVILVAIVEKFLSKLLIAIAGVDREEQGILLGKDRGERGGCRGIKIRLVRSRNPISSAQRGQHFFPAGLESRIVLPLALHEDDHFVGVGIGNVADALDFGTPEPLGLEAVAELIDIGRLGEAHIHIGAAFEIDSVANPATEQNRSPSSEEKNAAQGIEILGFAHPVQIGLFEELDHAAFASLP